LSLKIGIVGTGSVAKRNYLPCLATQEDMSLGYYNRTRSKADEVAGEFGGTVYDSLEALVDWSPDAVMVLTKETDRFDVSMALLECGPKRAFFEKPLVAKHGQEDVREEDFNSARELLAKAAAIGCETAMVFNYRFFDHPLIAKRVIEERGFGRAVNVSGLVHYACWSHAIDLVHHFADPVTELTALQSDSVRGEKMPARDVTAAFRTEADGTGTLIGTSALNWGFPLFELTINFEGGRIHIRDLDGDMEILDNSTGHHEVHAVSRDRSRWDQYHDSFAKSVIAYLASIREGQSPPVPGIAGLQELQVEAAIKRSIAENRPIDVQTEFSLSLNDQ
jgi:predicted dehydrogenase